MLPSHLQNKYKQSLVLLSALLFASLTQTALSANNSAPQDSRYQAAINETTARIHTLMQEKNIPGLAAAVAVDGKLIWSQGFGYADVENRIPATSLTRFRIASISKTVTTAAIGRLIDEGKLDLDKPVQAYVPDFPKKKWPITTRMLGGHLAGIRHYKGKEMASSKHYPTVNEGLVIFQDDPLLHQPGTRYKYSSYGWNLISAVIEGASGEDFLGYMKKNVFEPLGLRSIVAEEQNKIIQHRASFYIYNKKGELENAPYVDNSYKWAGGGFISGIEDLVKYGLSWINTDFIKAKTKKMLFTSQKTSDGKLTHYGVGFRSGTGPEKHQWVGHSGGAMGGRSMLLIYPKEKIVFAFMINSTPKKTPAVGTGKYLVEPFFK